MAPVAPNGSCWGVWLTKWFGGRLSRCLSCRTSRGGQATSGKARHAELVAIGPPSSTLRRRPGHRCVPRIYSFSVLLSRARSTAERAVRGATSPLCPPGLGGRRSAALAAPRGAQHPSSRHLPPRGRMTAGRVRRRGPPPSDPHRRTSARGPAGRAVDTRARRARPRPRQQRDTPRRIERLRHPLLARRMVGDREDVETAPAVEMTSRSARTPRRSRSCERGARRAAELVSSASTVSFAARG